MAKTKPRERNLIEVSLRLEKDMLELIKDMADDGRRPFTTQVRIILEKGLAALKEREPA